MINLWKILVDVWFRPIELPELKNKSEHLYPQLVTKEQLRR